MRKAKPRYASSGQSALDELDILIHDLRESYRKAVKHGSRGCAELFCALERAEAIRDMLRTNNDQSIDWDMLGWVLPYLLQWIKEILCSSINWVFPRRTDNDYWVYYKKTAASARCVAGGTIWNTWRYSYLPQYD